MAVAAATLGLLIAGGYGVSLLMPRTTQLPGPSGYPALQSDDPGVQEATVSAQPEPGGQLFAADDLGLRFSYAERSGAADWTVQRDGTRVYLVNDKQPDDRLRFVEVFDKEPEDSIQQAITKAVLDGFDPEDCSIQVVSYPASSSRYDSNQQRAVLRYNPKYLPEDLLMASEPGRCPAAYTPVNWLAYFVVDSRQPSRLLFVSVGQDAGPAAGSDPRKAWYETIALP